MGLLLGFRSEEGKSTSVKSVKGKVKIVEVTQVFPYRCNETDVKYSSSKLQTYHRVYLSLQV